MLVTFKTDVGNITMFEDAALTMIKMMGHSATVPGAILAADVPIALNRLKAALNLFSSVKPTKNDSNVVL